MGSNRRAYLENQWKKGLPIFRPERERPRSKAEQKAIDEALGHLMPYLEHAEDHRELVADKWRRKAADDLAAQLRRTYSLRDFMAEDGQLQLAAYNVVPMPVGWSRDTVEEAARQVLPPRSGWSDELVQNLALLAIISCADWQAQREEFLRAVFWLGWRLWRDQSVVLGMICRTRNWLFSHSTHEIADLARPQLPDGLFAPRPCTRSLRAQQRAGNPGGAEDGRRPTRPLGTDGAVAVGAGSRPTGAWALRLGRGAVGQWAH